MRSQVNSWTLLLTKLGFTRKNRCSPSAANLSYGRKLRFEHCEDRRLLATYTVNVDYDAAADLLLKN